MRAVHGRDEKSMVASRRVHSYDRSMLLTQTPYTRTLTLVLPESEWHALRTAEPDAVGWLQTQIKNRLSSSDAPRTPVTPPATFSSEDEY